MMANLRIPGFQRRILLVESDAELAAFLAAALRHAGIDLRLAANAEQAAELTTSLQPEIVVSNATLADTSAWLLIEKLRRRTKRLAVWVYACSPTQRDSAWATFSAVAHLFYYGDSQWNIFAAIIERLMLSRMISGSRNDSSRSVAGREITPSPDGIPFSTARSRS